MESTEERSWFPLILAGGFVAFALVVAVIAYVSNRTSDPSEASTVFGVATMAVEAVTEDDLDLARGLGCTDDLELAWASGTKAEATRASGETAGSFRLTVDGTAYDVTVAQDDARSCIESVRTAAP